MKKLFNKFFAGAIALVLVATTAFAVSFTSKTDAASTMKLGKWSFEQGGQYNPSEGGNEGYINKVTMSSGEEITGWKTGAGSKEQTQEATQDSTGFAVTIGNTGWDAQWKVNTGYPVTTINPWSIQAWVHSDMIADGEHEYQVTFKAKASKPKDLYVTFNTVVDGHEMPPYDTAPLIEGSDSQFVQLGPTEKTYTYKFKNYVGGTDLKTTFMLGAFTADEDNGRLYDYGQNDITDLIPVDTVYKNGTVTVTDFTVTDMDAEPTSAGPSTEAPTVAPSTEAPTVAPSTEAPTVAPSTEAPTAAPTEAPTVAPAPTKAPVVTTKAPAPVVKKLNQVKGVKVKSVKKKTIKVSWKKVANAKAYKVKVGKKTYNATKNSRKIKNKKFKKGKKIKVQVRATATGYTAGAWSKAKKFKIKK